MSPPGWICVFHININVSIAFIEVIFVIKNPLDLSAVLIAQKSTHYVIHHLI